MGFSSSVTAEDLDAILGNVRYPRFDPTKIINRLSDDEVCELATESTGNTTQTVQGLIDGVIQQCGGALPRDALAALNAVAWYHVPILQECADELKKDHRAD